MKALILQGGMFGDEGKGQLTDFLSRSAPDTSLVVRYGGGAQCAHTVVAPNNLTHTFSQFGSGTFAGIPTYLSKYVRVRPDWLLEEANELAALGIKNPLGMVTINENCLVNTIYHQIASEQAAAVHQRGTCGVGVGQTASYAAQYPQEALYMRDFNDRRLVQHKLTLMKMRLVLPGYSPPIDMVTEDLMLCARKIETVVTNDWWSSHKNNGTIIFEGHQGVLLDQWCGFAPYVTSSRCTYQNADALLDGYEGEREYYAVIRSYATRHGVGDFPTESSLYDDLPEPHNATEKYQGAFRRGWLDLDLVRRGLLALSEGYSREIKLVISHMDSILNLPEYWKVRMDGVDQEIRYFQDVERFVNRKVAILGYGARSTEWHWTHNYQSVK